jgi:putative FmdB family regulatory protein
MPQYDYRCENCGERFSIFYKTYSDYDESTPQCPNCASESLARLITSVAIQTPARDYTKMNSNEMLSVFESGDSRQVGEMFQQFGGNDPALGLPYQEATEKLLKGEKPEKVEKDISGGKSGKGAP